MGDGHYIVTTSADRDQREGGTKRPGRKSIARNTPAPRSRPSSITHPEWQTLRALKLARDIYHQPSLREIAVLLKRYPSTVLHHLRNLEAKGYVSLGAKPRQPRSARLLRPIPKEPSQ